MSQGRWKCRRNWTFIYSLTNRYFLLCAKPHVGCWIHRWHRSNLSPKGGVGHKGTSSSRYSHFFPGLGDKRIPRPHISGSPNVTELTRINLWGKKKKTELQHRSNASDSYIRLTKRGLLPSGIQSLGISRERIWCWNSWNSAGLWSGIQGQIQGLTLCFSLPSGKIRVFGQRIPQRPLHLCVILGFPVVPDNSDNWGHSQSNTLSICTALLVLKSMFAFSTSWDIIASILQMGKLRLQKTQSVAHSHEVLQRQRRY